MRGFKEMTILCKCTENKIYGFTIVKSVYFNSQFHRWKIK